MAKNNVITIPKGIKLRGTDVVTYYAKSPSAKEKQKYSNVCYAHHMGQLHSIQMWLVPDKQAHADCAVPGDLYLKWFDLLKAYRLAPANVEATVEKDGNKLYIPSGNSRHLVYAALCGYRWAESLAPMVYTILKLVEERKDISFWQALHYGFALYVTSWGHSWSYLCHAAGVYIMHNNGQACNLASSLSFPIFWNNEKRKIDTKKSGYGYANGYVCTDIASLTTKLDPLDKIKTGGRERTIWGFCIDGNSDSVLDPKWTPLYARAESLSQIPDLDLKAAGVELKKMYDEVTKDDKGHKELLEKIGKSFR